MGVLNDVISAALRNHNVPQVVSTGTSSLAEALHSLLEPQSTADTTPNRTHAQPGAFRNYSSDFNLAVSAKLSSHGSALAPISLSNRNNLAKPTRIQPPDEDQNT